MERSKNIKWFTPDSEDGERTLKQHAFIHKIRKAKYTREEYNGNISLCGRIAISEDGERSCDWVAIEAEMHSPLKACKLCNSIYEREYLSSTSLVTDNK